MSGGKIEWNMKMCLFGRTKGRKNGKKNMMEKNSNGAHQILSLEHRMENKNPQYIN